MRSKCPMGCQPICLSTQLDSLCAIWFCNFHLCRFLPINKLCARAAYPCTPLAKRISVICGEQQQKYLMVFLPCVRFSRPLINKLSPSCSSPFLSIFKYFPFFFPFDSLSMLRRDGCCESWNKFARKFAHDATRYCACVRVCVFDVTVDALDGVDVNVGASDSDKIMPHTYLCEMWLAANHCRKSTQCKRIAHTKQSLHLF